MAHQSNIEKIFEELFSTVETATTGAVVHIPVAIDASIEVVMLCNNGLDDDVVYRYDAPEGFGGDWELGTLEDAIAAAIDTSIEWLKEALTDEDVAGWHNGDMTTHVKQLLDATPFDCIEITGTYSGALDVTFC